MSLQRWFGLQRLLPINMVAKF
jgi:hypothetical protein